MSLLPALAHQGSVVGVVYDRDTRVPLAGATVQIGHSGLSAVTNTIGEFKIKNLNPGANSLTISYMGYQSMALTCMIRDGESTFLNVFLKPGAVDLSELQVQAPLARPMQFNSQIDISLRPIQNAQEVLRIVPGLFIGQHAGGGKAEQIFLRGFDIDHGTDIAITADGIPVNMVSHAHGQGYADLHFVIPELIEKADFQKGPYSPEKGNFATAGWVDFRTREVLSRNFVKAEVGQFDTYRAVGALDLLSENRKARGESAYVAGEYNFSNSYFDSLQRFNRLNGLARYNRKLGKNQYLTASVSRFWSRWNHSGQIPDRAVESGSISHFGAIDDTEGGLTSRTNASLQLTSQSPAGAVLKQQLYYSRYAFELYSNFTFFLHDPVHGDQIRQRESRNLLGYTGSYTKTTYIRDLPAELSAGVHYRQDLTAGSELSRTINRTYLSEALQRGNINEATVGAYISESLTLTPGLSLTLGLRMDLFRNHYTNQLTDSVGVVLSGIVSPKFSMYYTPRSSFQLYLTSGKGFHSNDTRVVVPRDGKSVLPPAYGVDLGINWKPIPRVFVNAAVWYLGLSQEFVYVGDEGVVEPGGRTARKGVDVSARYQLSKSLFLDTDLTLTQPRARDTEAGAWYLPLAPRITASGGLSYRRLQGLNGSVRYRYLADRPANEDYSLVAKGYFITDAQLNYTRHQYVVGVSVVNLFNSRWKETQFATESRLKNERQSVKEIHYTAGSPFFARLSLTYYFK